MLDLLLIWLALLAVLLVFAIGRPREGGALTLAYFLDLSLIHVPGVLPFTFSQDVPFLFTAQGLHDPDATRVGFQLTVIGMGAFVTGAVLARIFDARRALWKGHAARREVQTFHDIGRRALIFGAFAYFVLMPVAGLVPSLTSVVSALGALLIVGLWLMLYGAVREADEARVRSTLALLPLLPLATLATGGFIRFGVAWVFAILAFLFVISNKRVWFYLAAPIVVYLGLSLFVTYMGQRLGIRDVVWNAQSGFVERFARISNIVTDFQLIDLRSSAHITALDDRLNQNALVGLAVGHLESGWSEFALGATVPVWALIPRAVWPDKPIVGGGGTVVTEFTGIAFDKATSVGTGQVFDFYVNFGTPGVVIGFLLLGFGLMWLDRGIMHALAADDTRGMLLRALPGLTLLQPGGNLLEIVVSCAAAVIAAHFVVNMRAFRIFRVARAGGEAG